MNRAQLIMARFDLAEYALCRRLNRGAGVRPFGALLRIASRLGDGIVWYMLVAALPLLYGRAALRPAIGMAITGIIGLLIYRWLKRALVRERPFMRHPGIPLASLIAASRVVLGLHYPSDVLAGGAIGALLGMLALSCF